MRSPAYLRSRVLFNKSVGQLSSSEPSLHCNTPSQRDSSGTHSPLLHLNSAVWSHSGCVSFSPTTDPTFGCRVCVHSLCRRNKRIVVPVGVHLKVGGLKKRRTTNENENLIVKEIGVKVKKFVSWNNNEELNKKWNKKI